MPIYCEIETESKGAFFKNCGTKEVAGRNFNTSKSAGDDYCLLHGFRWDISLNNNSHTERFDFIFTLDAPAFSPAIASACNVMNEQNQIKKMTIKVTDGVSAIRNTVTEQYIGENGTLEAVHLEKDSKTEGSLTLMLRFEKLTVDDLVANTSGVIKTNDLGG